MAKKIILSARDIQILGIALFVGFLGNFAATWLYDVLCPTNRFVTGLICFLFLVVFLVIFLFRRNSMEITQ